MLRTEGLRLGDQGFRFTGQGSKVSVLSLEVCRD